MIKEETICPLCLGGDTRHYHRDRRSYRQCRRCDLVYVPAAFHLDAVAEKRRYDQHRNNPQDPAYRAFLSRLMIPLLERLPPGAQGLDYGSGPGPTLSLMLAERGHAMNIYDAFYAPHEAALARRYDFLTCSETMEHFAAPGREWRRFLSLVRAGGWIGIMTQLREAKQDFAAWYYKNDDTHVCFYSRATFEFLARRHDLKLYFEEASVILLRR
ncbi:MAG: class I SAM-dependent methyltransferase [Gammaproteobacteria bacterium]